MKKILSGLLFISGLALLFSCSDGIDYEKIRREELANLKLYIDNVHPGAEPTASGLYYFNEEGTGHGDTIKLGDQVQIYYATWALYDGTDSVLVDQTNGYLLGHRYEPYKFIPGAGTSIAGLEEAITYMQPGTRSHLVINSELAYGQNGSTSGGIGMFQTILMEVEVYKVIPRETE
ncbi:FKBP-type peptidyl-prolyl cis-trans isomerase [Maribellus sediminis]|uniref:FKBP-type peptidyl-prolyl cis-trans isomerase n=1 Tax=Maribellus sediminis TaxID=2696285 RepID=UPI001430E914|nr:FKBP-type peptidyl-prolyl cis-trans isomerase [Maribellus sediminis]